MDLYFVKFKIGYFPTCVLKFLTEDEAKLSLLTSWSFRVVSVLKDNLSCA